MSSTHTMGVSVASADEEQWSRARLLDADAWEAYARACQRGSTDEIRRSRFTRAMQTMESLARLERKVKGSR